MMAPDTKVVIVHPVENKNLLNVLYFTAIIHLVAVKTVQSKPQNTNIMNLKHKQQRTVVLCKHQQGCDQTTYTQTTDVYR